MLTKLRIVNFKCLEDTGDIDVRPLTFLVGPNSSGKSSVLQALIMLRQTIDSADVENPLVANNGWIKAGSYPDFIFRHEIKRDLEIHLKFAEPESNRSTKGQLKLGEEQHSMELKAIFSYNPKTTRIRLEKSELSFWCPTGRHNRTIQQIVRKPATNIYSLFLEEAGTEGGPLKRDGIKLIKFYSFDPEIIRGEDIEPFIDKITPIINLQYITNSEFRLMFYLGPLREYPKRFYVTSGQAPQDVGIQGEKAVDVLWFAHRSKRFKTLETKVNYWMKEFGIASQTKLERLGKGNHYRVMTIDLNTGVESNIADIGFGASQLFPVIIEGFYSPSGSLILVEQPEIHLHPKAQAALGDLFVDSVNETERTFIIETHSEHLLARVRRRIAEGRIRCDQVAIYYFEPTSEGIKIRHVGLNECGQLKEFPEGFFEEDFEEAIAHLREIQKRKESKGEKAS